jgi:hypothetical protein
VSSPRGKTFSTRERRSENGYIRIDAERQHRQAEQISDAIVSSESTHRPAVLTGHHRRTVVIDHGAGDVPCGKEIGESLDSHELIDGNPAEPVSLDGQQPGERVGPHAGAPHHSGRRNHLAGSKCHPVRIDRDDLDPRKRLDPQGGQGLLDDLPGGFAHVRADAWLMIGQNDTERAGLSGPRHGRPQFAGHLRRGLDAGQATSDDHYRKSAG